MNDGKLLGSFLQMQYNAHALDWEGAYTGCVLGVLSARQNKHFQGSSIGNDPMMNSEDGSFSQTWLKCHAGRWIIISM